MEYYDLDHHTVSGVLQVSVRQLQPLQLGIIHVGLYMCGPCSPSAIIRLLLYNIAS